jgi:uncharacterized protein (DUF4415 family)
MAKKKTKKTAAKKTAKKAPVRQAAKKAAKKPARKVAQRAVKKAAAKKSPARRAPAAENPAPVSTGRGPSPLEIGRDVVAMFNAGQLGEIEKKWWSADIVSVEGHGMAMAWSGRDKVNEKNAWWMERNTLHGASAEGPYVGASGFAIKFRMDVEDKASGGRQTMEEVGVYTVRDGTIIREEFMYRTPTA